MLYNGYQNLPMHHPLATFIQKNKNSNKHNSSNCRNNRNKSNNSVNRNNNNNNNNYNSDNNYKNYNNYNNNNNSQQYNTKPAKTPTKIYQNREIVATTRTVTIYGA